MKNVTLVTLLVAGVFGCKTAEHSEPRRGETRPVLAHGTQTDLARELDAAERTGTWEAIAARWRGRRLAWTVTLYPSLCASGSACHVAAFPVQRPATRGWLPGLEMRDSEYRKVEAGCAAAEQCKLLFEGTLRDLVVSPELPTSMTFSDVRVLSVTPT